MPLSNITLIIRKIFDDYDEKNGAQQKTDYAQRAENIVQTWTQSMAKEGLTTNLICELHRLVCEDEWIPINDPKGGIAGFAKAGEYRTMPSSAPSYLKKGAVRLFAQPHEITAKMEQLVATMNKVLTENPPKALMIENILAFSVELSTVHPFPNQNWRVIFSLMELLAYHAELEPFYISQINKINPQLLIRSLEETIAYQTVQPLLESIEKYKNEQVAQNININDNEGIGSFFAYTVSTFGIATVYDLLPELKNKTVLDAGCGDGAYAQYFTNNGSNVIGIDGSKIAINKAIETIGDKASFIHANLEEPLEFFDDKSFDFIFSNLVIHYIKDWDRLFKEFFRILKTGGSCVFVVSHPLQNIIKNYLDIELTRQVYYMENKAPIEIEYFRRPFQSIINSITQAGFVIGKIVETEENRFIAIQIFKYDIANQFESNIQKKLKFDNQIIEAAKIYGNMDYDYVEIDKTSIYSCISPYHISSVESIFKLENINPKTIIDATANIGMQTINFLRIFPSAKISSIEIDTNIAKILEKNIDNIDSILGFKPKHKPAVINRSCIEFLEDDTHVDMIHFDPPWGGPDYYLSHSLDMHLDDIPIGIIIGNVLSRNITPLVVLMLPLNANLDAILSDIRSKIDITITLHDVTHASCKTVDYRLLFIRPQKISSSDRKTNQKEKTNV